MRRLAWVVLALIAAWLVFVGGGWLGIYTTELRVITVSLAGLVLAGWAVVAWQDPAWRPRSVMAPAIVACLGSMTISTIFSRVPRVSLEYLGYAILLAALYLLMVQLMVRPFFRERLVALASAMFLAVSFEYIGYVVYLWIQWWGNVGHLAVPPLRPNFVSLTYGNPSAAFTISALLAVPAAAKWATSWSARGVVSFVGVGLIVAVMAILSGSRAGWLGLGVALACALGAASVSSEVRRHALAARRRVAIVPRWGRVASVVVGVLALGLLVAVLPFVLQRVAAGGEDVRTNFYRAAVRMFLASPFVGTGLGTWVIQRIAFTQAPETDYYIPHAHDVPLQVLAEQGLVGAVAALVLIANLVIVLRGAGRAEVGAIRRWAWITAIGLIYLAVHDLLDFYPNMPGILFAAALPVAFLDAWALERRAAPSWASKRARNLASIAGLAAVAIATAGLLVQEIPAHDQDVALEAASAGDWATALVEATRAASTDPGISPYAFVAAMSAAELNDHHTAAKYFEQVARQDDLPEAWLNLAAEQVALAEREAALTSLERALRLGIQRVQVAIPAAELARELGERGIAVDVFAAAVASTPSFAADPWWNADPDRAALLPVVLMQASANATPDARVEIALMRGDVDGALTLANGAADQRVRLFIAAWAGDSAAFDDLIGACLAHPLDGQLITWCARVENHRGDHAQAGRFRDLMDALSGGSSFQGLELRVLTPGTPGPYAVPSSSYGWFFYTYRRSGPIDPIDPGLVHLRYA